MYLKLDIVTGYNILKVEISNLSSGWETLENVEASSESQTELETEAKSERGPVLMINKGGGDDKGTYGTSKEPRIVHPDTVRTPFIGIKLGF